jgi:hypothetical protein
MIKLSKNIKMKDKDICNKIINILDINILDINILELHEI